MARVWIGYRPESPRVLNPKLKPLYRRGKKLRLAPAKQEDENVICPPAISVLLIPIGAVARFFFDAI